MSSPLKDISKLCIHTFTHKPWSLAEVAERFGKAGVKGISVWQNVTEDIGAKEAANILHNSGLEVVSYVRGGFFPKLEIADRQKAIDDNKRLLDDAATVGAPLLVLVCGAEPNQSLEVSRAQIQEGIEALIPHAAGLGVKLGIEPLHPMYADTRSAINTLYSANRMAEAIDHPSVGVVFDVYHLWWEPNLEQEIQRCGAHGNLFAYHICDWAVPTTDLLVDRELMGKGCIPLKQIREWIEATGFNGYNEVEIFSEKYWSMDQDTYLQDIIKAYLEHA